MDTLTELPASASRFVDPCEAERSATGWPPRRWRPNWDSAVSGTSPAFRSSATWRRTWAIRPISWCCWEAGRCWARSPCSFLRRALVKEWAYAGAFFTYTGAIVSHLTTGYDLGEVGLLAVMTALTMLSWALRPPSRRIHQVTAP